MKKIFFIVSFFISIFSVAQNAAQWENIYGGPGNEYGYRVRTCLDQGYIVAGSTSSSGISDGYLVRVDSLGLVMWYKYYRGNNVDIFRSIKQLPDSGYIIAGYSNSSGTHGGYDGWVMRTDKNGDSLWSKYIGTSNWDFFYDVTQTYDGNFILAGGTYGQGEGDEDMYFVKIDANGDTLWTRTQGGIKTDEARGIIECGDSLIAAVGFSNSLGDLLGDSWIMRMRETNGDTLWSKTLGQSNIEDKAWGLADFYAANRIIIVGETSIQYGDPDAYIQSMTYGGSVLFNIVFGGAGTEDNFTGIICRPNGTMAAIGTTENVMGNGHGDMYFYHDRTGPFNTIFGSTSVEAGCSIDLAHDDGYIVCGFTEGFNNFVPQVWLIKIDTTGLSTGVLGIREAPTPTKMASSTVFPNPANQDAEIMYDSFDAISGDLQMNIFDITGRLVETIPNSKWQKTSARNATCIIEVSNLNDGIYQFVIHDNANGKSTGKIIVSH